MSKSRYKKTTQSSFEKAVKGLAKKGLSEEATSNLANMVLDVATECGHNDSIMIRRLMARLNHVAKKRTRWAVEVLDVMKQATT